MLSVNGLPHILKTNKSLLNNTQISVSLHNGPRIFIVTGPPCALYGLVANLYKICVPNGFDQCKAKLSKRKPVFSARFLVAGMPFHGQYQGQYLRDATDKVINEEHNVEELWTAGGLQITVYYTEDGRLNDWLSFIDSAQHLFRLRPPITCWLVDVFHLRPDSRQAPPLAQTYRPT